jgi:hypothetical protein
MNTVSIKLDHWSHDDHSRNAHHPGSNHLSKVRDGAGGLYVNFVGFGRYNGSDNLESDLEVSEVQVASTVEAGAEFLIWHLTRSKTSD